MIPNILVLFDFDGTLADSLPLSCFGFNCVLETCGLARLSLHDFLRSVHAPYYDSYVRLGVSLPRDKVSQIYHAAVDQESAELFPDVRDALENLRARYSIAFGIISASRASWILDNCRRGGIVEYFRYISGHTEIKSDEIGRMRRRVHVPRDRTLYLGDLKSDMIDARSANVIGVGVNRHGINDEALKAVGARHCIKSLHELAPILDELLTVSNGAL